MMKKALKEHGQLSTTPTEQGKKDLDLFHLSYRVKNVNKLALKDLFVLTSTWTLPNARKATWSL